MSSQHKPASLPLKPQWHSMCLQLLTSEVPPRSDLTWRWLTDLAALPREALRTVAAIAVTFLQAAASMETGVGLAWVILHCERDSVREEGREREFQIYSLQRRSVTKVYTTLTNDDRRWVGIMPHSLSSRCTTSCCRLTEMRGRGEGAGSSRRLVPVSMSFYKVTDWLLLRLSCPMFIMSDAKCAESTPACRSHASHQTEERSSPYIFWSSPCHWCWWKPIFMAHYRIAQEIINTFFPCWALTRCLSPRMVWWMNGGC